MLTKGDWFMRTQGKTNGKYLKDIAEELGVHPRTVRRALDRGGPGTVGRPSGKSKLDPYKRWIDQRLGEGVWNAVVLYREIQEQGYSGEITLVRDYVRPKRVLRSASRRTVRFETRPGQQMQNDWGGDRDPDRRDRHESVFFRQHAGVFPLISLLGNGLPGCGTHL